jgi:hypothetical protein
MPGLMISNEPIGDKPIIRGLQVDKAAASVVLPMMSFVDPGQASKEDQVPPGGGRGNFFMHTYRQLLLPLPQRLPTIV